MHRSRYAHCTNGLCFVEDRGADARHTGFILFVIHRVSNLSYSLEFFAHPLPRTARQLGQVEEIWRPRIVSTAKSKHRFTHRALMRRHSAPDRRAHSERTTTR